MLSGIRAIRSTEPESSGIAREIRTDREAESLARWADAKGVLEVESRAPQRIAQAKRQHVSQAYSMSAKSKRRRKALRAIGRTAEIRASVRREEMIQAVAENRRVWDAFRDGAATDEEREKCEDRMRLFEAWPPGLLYDGLMTWEALEKLTGITRD